MAARHQYRSPTHTPELSLSDTEESYSSDEEMPERGETDSLLRKAHHYVITEGGKDSPTTYMERIHRINGSLIQEISTHGYDCDPKLFRRVKQKIDHVLREFEDAVDADSSVYDHDELSEYYIVPAKEGLYRMDSSPLTPEGPFARRLAKLGGKEDTERTYLYGGPNNHPESWYEQAAASLPFPETVRMADWESLRIHWDLANTGRMERTEPVTGNAVSFNDARLAHHNSLAQYESGLRFKLPVSDPSDTTKVNKFGTVNELHNVIDAFHRGDDTEKENGDYKYAPRVFLERLDVGQQNSPANLVDQVRSAVNTTPTKLRSSSRIGSAPPATRAFIKNSQWNSPSGPVEKASSLNFKDNDPSVAVSSLVSEASRSQATAASPAVRRIKAATEASIRSSSLPQSPPTHFETQVATHVSSSTNKIRARPRKNASPTAAMPAYLTTATGKRKRLSVDVVEEETEKDIEVEAAPSKRRQITIESTRPRTPIMPTGPEDLDTPATLPALTPASSAVSTPPVAKARVAGKTQRKIRTKRDFEQRVSPEKFDEIMTGRKSTTAAAGHESIARGSTRSGKVRKA